MGGYGPATTGFSLALKKIGDRLEAKFGDQIEVRYVYNILDLGYRAEDILWLVESGVITLGYQSSSYLTDRIPALGVVDLPFLFSDQAKARAAMDGALGRALTTRIEANTDFRIVGYFENGFRHVSNRVRSIHTPADMKGMSIRVLPSKIQERTFQLLGAEPRIMDLSEALVAIKAGKLDAQENPFSNTVTYGVHQFHRFHTATNHFYVSRPIFVHRPGVRRMAAGVAARTSRRGSRCDRVPARSAREGRRGCCGGDQEGRRRDRRVDDRPTKIVRVSRQPDLRRGAQRTRARGARSGESVDRSMVSGPQSPVMTEDRGLRTGDGGD